METIFKVVFFLALVHTISTTPGTVCLSDLDCGNRECCYIPSPFQVVSKRQAVLPLEPISLTRDAGTCEQYRTLGEHCNPVEKMNGHCGCGPGLYCHHTPPTTLAPLQAAPSIVRRRPLPGTYECAATG